MVKLSSLPRYRAYGTYRHVSAILAAHIVVLVLVLVLVFMLPMLMFTAFIMLMLMIPLPRLLLTLQGQQQPKRRISIQVIPMQSLTPQEPQSFVKPHGSGIGDFCL